LISAATIEDEQEPEMPTTMFPIGQTVSAENTSAVDPTNDLAYLQEQLLREKWLKIMSYSQKKKKKKKKEKKEKTDLPQNVTTASTSTLAPKFGESEVKGSSPTKPVDGCPLLLKALTKSESVTKPFESATKPLESVIKPFESATKPFESVTKSFEIVTKPLESVTKPFSCVKTYSKTERRSDWFSKESDHTLFDSDSGSDNSSTAQQHHTSISRQVAKKSFSNSIRRFSLQTDSSTTTTTSSLISQNNLPKSSTADEYEFSDNEDESAILNEKRFSSFKSNNFKERRNSSIVGSSSNQSDVPLTNGKCPAPTKTKYSKSLSSQRKIQNQKVDSIKKVEPVIKTQDKNVFSDSKTISRKSSVSSISSSSDESIILKGSSSTTTSSSSPSPRRSRLNSSSSAGGKSITENVTPVQAGNQLEFNDVITDEMEPDLVCSSLAICNKNVSSSIEDEILGDEESRGEKPAEEVNENEDKTSTPCPTKATCTKYKSNRYYKPSQSAVLWEFYRKNQYPSKSEQAALAEQLGGIEIKRIIWWFTHRRRTDKNNPEFSHLLSQGKKVKLQDGPSKDVLPTLGADVTLACAATNTCSLCSFSDVRPKLLRHLKSKHGYKPVVCRRCQKIWQQGFFEEHPCTAKKSPKKKSSAENKSPPKTDILLVDKSTPESEITLEEKSAPINPISREDESTPKILLEDELTPKKLISAEDTTTTQTDISIEDKSTTEKVISIKTEVSPEKKLNEKKRSPKKKDVVQELQSGEVDSKMMKVVKEKKVRKVGIKSKLFEVVEEKIVRKVETKSKLLEVEANKEEVIIPLKEELRSHHRPKSEDEPENFNKKEIQELANKSVIITNKKSSRKEIPKRVLTPDVIESEDDASMDVTSPVPDDSVLVQTPIEDQPDISVESTKMEVDDDDVDDSILPIGFGTRCSSCPYDGPNILRHFQAIHHYKGKKCRKCGHFWQIEEIEGHPCEGQPNHLRERPQDLKERPLQQQSKKAAQKEAEADDDDEVEAEDEEEECSQVSISPTFYEQLFHAKKIAKKCHIFFE